MIWVCDVCYEKMEVEEGSMDRKRVYCQHCENEFYVDDDDECINEFESTDDSDFEFELADFCSGGDLTED